MIQRSTITGAMLCLLLAGACNASSGREVQRDPEQSELRQQDGDELVEITVRMPDGRVIKRMERKIASRVDAELPELTENRPPIVRKNASSNANGDIETLNGGVHGGSNPGGVQPGGSGGGGGGSSTSHAGGGGGGGGDSARTSGGGHSGGSTDDTIQPVQPDSDLTVRMYAWDNTGAPFNHIQEAIVADPRGRSPQQLARSISQQVSSSRHDKVVLRFWKEFDPATRFPFDTSNPRQLLLLGGYSDGLTQYWTQFAQELSTMGVEPDYLIFDQEQGISFWHIPSSERRDYFEELLDPNQPLSQALPDSMRGVSVSDFMNFRSSEGQTAFEDYNKFATEFRADFIRRVFVEPFNSVFGREIHASNYWDLIPGFPVMRYTGREMQYATIAGISAPVTYLDDRGDSGVRYNDSSKHQRWNRLIDKLNFVRSTAIPGWTTPWIAPPGYGRNGPDTWARADQLDEEQWLWDTKMDHMLAMGIDTYILWNPSARFNPNAATTDVYMEDWLSRNPSAPTNQLRNLDPIPLDADEIVTNGVVTTYDEFLDMMNLDGSQ